jgi:hypothetical protein
MSFRTILTILPFAFLTLKTQAQATAALQKTWTLIQTRSIKTDTVMKNALSRLRFDDEKIYVTLPGINNELPQPYTLTGLSLKGSFVTYTIELITDSSLILSTHDQKLHFLAEGFSPCGDSVIQKIGEYNGHPYYKTTNYLQPRNSGEPLFKAIENAINFDRQTQKITVGFSFIVDEKGMVQNAKILQSYSPEIDAIVLKQIQKTSGKWLPPTACRLPVATELGYIFVYDPIPH